MMATPDAAPLAGITELEAAFNGPDGAAARGDALARLNACKAAVEGVQRHHLPVDTFAASQALAAALDAAAVVILKPSKKV
ncbi:MAG: hypothetical protein AAF318_01295 [Pseudomonadota bacterium]